MLVINPDECIDCAVCIPECPVDAIRAENDLTADQQQWIQINADLAQVWPVITQKIDALPDADKWAQVKDKQHLINRG
jgi:ferredoxin